MNISKCIQIAAGIFFIIIGLLFWAFIGYNVISEDLGQMTTLKIYWKDMLYMIFFICSGFYLLRDLK